MSITICELDGVREHGERYPVELIWARAYRRLVLTAWNEGHNNMTEIDFEDLVMWLSVRGASAMKELSALIDLQKEIGRLRSALKIIEEMSRGVAGPPYLNANGAPATINDIASATLKESAP